MLKLRYYCKGEAKEEIQAFLTDIKSEHGIPYEILILSGKEIHDEEKEKQVYEGYFKPRAKILKKRTGKSIRELRGGRGKKHYYVSIPGTMAITVDEKIEWYTIGDKEIIKFLKLVLSNGYAYIEELLK